MYTVWTTRSQFTRWPLNLNKTFCAYRLIAAFRVVCVWWIKLEIKNITKLPISRWDIQSGYCAWSTYRLRWVWLIPEVPPQYDSAWSDIEGCCDERLQPWIEAAYSASEVFQLTTSYKMHELLLILDDWDSIELALDDFGMSDSDA